MENLVHQHRSMHWNPLIQEIQAKDQLIYELQCALNESRHQLQEMSLVLESMGDARRHDVRAKQTDR